MNTCKHGVLLYGARCISCEREKHEMTGCIYSGLHPDYSKSNYPDESSITTKYKRLRLIQLKIDQAIHHKNNRMLHVIQSDEARSKLSNAIDQIEQALELIKKVNTDSVVAEILIEIDGEVRL